MPGVALAKTPRNERILDLCGSHDSATIRAMIYREMGIDMTANAVNCVIDRGKKAQDPRALSRKSRRGRRSLSPWNTRRAGARKKVAAPIIGAVKPRPAVDEDLWPASAPLPATSVHFIDALKFQCRFPLRGSGIGLIVCGADVVEKKSYCPACLERTILREEGGRTPATVAPEPDRMLRSDVPAAVPRDAPRVEKPAARRLVGKISKPKIGLDGLDLAAAEPQPVRMAPRHRVRVPRPPQRTFFDRGQMDLFREGACPGYADRGYSDWSGRAWLIAGAYRQGMSTSV